MDGVVVARRVSAARTGHAEYLYPAPQEHLGLPLSDRGLISTNRVTFVVIGLRSSRAIYCQKSQSSLMPRTFCDQCGEERSIVSMREVCRDCARDDRRLDDLTFRLWRTVMEENWLAACAFARDLEKFYA